MPHFACAHAIGGPWPSGFPWLVCVHQSVSAHGKQLDFVGCRLEVLGDDASGFKYPRSLTPWPGYVWGPSSISFSRASPRVMIYSSTLKAGLLEVFLSLHHLLSVLGLSLHLPGKLHALNHHLRIFFSEGNPIKIDCKMSQKSTPFPYLLLLKAPLFSLRHPEFGSLMSKTVKPQRTQTCKTGWREDSAAKKNLVCWCWGFTSIYLYHNRYFLMPAKTSRNNTDICTCCNKWTIYVSFKGVVLKLLCASESPQAMLKQRFKYKPHP